MPVSNVFLAIGSTLAGLCVALGASQVMPTFDYLARQRVKSLLPMAAALRISKRSMTIGLRAWGVLMMGTPLVVGPVLGMTLLVVPLMLLFYQLPRWILAWEIHRRKQTLRDQMVPFCFALANTARSSLALPQGIQEVVRESPRPIRDEMQRLLQEYQRGRTLQQAIRDTQQRLKLDTFNIFAAMLLTCHETGANYTEALDKLSHSLQEHQRLERKLDAETAGGRWVIAMLAGFPVFFLGLFHVIDAENNARIFTTSIGQAVLVVVGLITYVSVTYARFILAIKI